MDIYRAIMVAEGAIETDDLDELMEAWQLLVDDGIVWKLQGCFGRKAKELIEVGLVNDPNSD